MTDTMNGGWPGATVGIFGGGQLGRMVALEARRLGIRTVVLDPDPRCPAGQVADRQVVASYGDCTAARGLARDTDVITYEFEHIDVEAVAAAEELRPVYPGSKVLEVVQHRRRQKETLFGMGFPLAAFRSVETWQDLVKGLESLGFPAVLKTAVLGYDGKGQSLIRSEPDARSAYDLLRPQSDILVLEEYIPFAKEISVLCARDIQGQCICYPVMENEHQSGILDVTIAPARIDASVAAAAQRLGQSITEHMKVIGLICVEMFLTGDNRLLVNELAPRPHNSAHYTLDACMTSQFEQLLRILCGLPLGSTELTSPAVMVNLLGDLWLETVEGPDFEAALAVPGAKLHLYGKMDVRPGRKMGHICVLGPTGEVALQRALEARAAITREK